MSGEFVKTIKIELSEYEHLKKCAEENAFLYVRQDIYGSDSKYILSKKEEVVNLLINEIYSLRDRNEGLNKKIREVMRMTVREFKSWRY